MLKLLIFVVSFWSLSCSCTKKNTGASVIENSSITDDCPADGKCTTILIENKSLNIKMDETGASYYELTDNSKTSVIKFEYNKTVDTTFQDNSYREEVLFEIPNQFDKINLENNELESVKMLFGKHCFCRGQAGIYAVKKGKLNIIKEGINTSINLEIEISNIDHTIKKISETIK